MLSPNQILVFELVNPMFSKRTLKTLCLVSKQFEELTFAWRFKELVPLHTSWLPSCATKGLSPSLLSLLLVLNDLEEHKWHRFTEKIRQCARKITVVVEKLQWNVSDSLPTPEHGAALIISSFPFLCDLKLSSATAYNPHSRARPWNFDPIAQAIHAAPRLRSLNLGNDFGEAVDFSVSLVETCGQDIETLFMCIRRQRDATFFCHLLNGARKTLKKLTIIWGLPPRFEEQTTISRDIVSPILQSGSYEKLTRFRLTCPSTSTTIDEFLSKNPQITDLGCDLYRAPEVTFLASLRALSLDGIDIGATVSLVQSLPNPAMLHTLKISIGAFTLPDDWDVATFSILTGLKHLWIKSPPRHKNPGRRSSNLKSIDQSTLPGSAALILCLPSLETLQVSGGFPFPVDIAANPSLEDDGYVVPAESPLRQGFRVVDPGGVFDFDFYTLLSSVSYRELSHWGERKADKVMWEWANNISAHVTTGMLKLARSLPHLKTVFYAPWGTSTRFAYLDVIIERKGKAGPNQTVQIGGGFHCGMGVLRWPRPGAKSSRPKRATNSPRGRLTKPVSRHPRTPVQSTSNLFSSQESFNFDFSRMSLFSDPEENKNFQ